MMPVGCLQHSPQKNSVLKMVSPKYILFPLIQMWNLVLIPGFTKKTIKDNNKKTVEMLAMFHDICGSLSIKYTMPNKLWYKV